MFLTEDRVGFVDDVNDHYSAGYHDGSNKKHIDVDYLAIQGDEYFQGLVDALIEKFDYQLTLLQREEVIRLHQLILKIEPQEF